MSERRGFLSMNPTRWALLLALNGVIATKVGFFLPPSVRLDAYVYGSPALAICSSLMLVASLAWLCSTSPFRNRRLADLLLSLGLMLLIALHIPAERRIESDESRMLATAQAIQFTGTALAVESGVFREDGTLVATSTTLDKRGVFFPAQVAVLNSLLGVSDEHPFWLSWLSGLFSLFIFTRLARRIMPNELAIFAPILLATMPLFAVHSRVGTFDLMNFAVLLLFTHSAISCVCQPSLRSWFLVVVSGCVLSQLRYESAAVVALIMCLFMGLSVTSPRFRTPIRGWILIAPWALIPAALRTAIPFDDLLPAPWFHAWSFQNFETNIEHLIVWMVTGGQTMTGNPYLTPLWLAFILGMLPIFRWNPIDRGIELPIVALMVTMLSTSVVVVLHYYWGNASLGFTVRYFLPMAAITVLLALVGIGRITESTRFKTAIAVGLVSVSTNWGYTHSANGGVLSQLGFAHATNLALTELDLSEFRCSGIVIAEPGLLFTNQGYSSISRAELERTGLERLNLLAGQQLDVLDMGDLLLRSANSELVAYIRARTERGSCNRKISSIDLRLIAD